MKHARHDGDAGPARGAASRLVLPSQHACSCAGLCDVLKVRRSGAGCSPCGSNGDEAGGVLPIGVGSALERQAGGTTPVTLQDSACRLICRVHGPTQHAAIAGGAVHVQSGVLKTSSCDWPPIQLTVIDSVRMKSFFWKTCHRARISQPRHAPPIMHLRMYARPCLAACCRRCTSLNVYATH